MSEKAIEARRNADEGFAKLRDENDRLRTEVERLTGENASLREQMLEVPDHMSLEEMESWFNRYEEFRRASRQSNTEQENHSPRPETTEKKNYSGARCECGSHNTVWIRGGGYQAADASRGMPEIETNGEIACNDCGRTWWD